jgi:hypothetical protein
VFGISRHRRLLLALVLVACKRAPKAGDACSPNSNPTRCLDESTILVCNEQRVFVAGACKGPRGCATTDGDVGCDFRGNVEGDPCVVPVDAIGHGCGTDGVHQVACVRGKTVVAVCRGPKGCEEQCDNTVWELGDPCVADGLQRYPFCGDHVEISCVDGGVGPLRPCPGGCSVHEDTKGDEWHRTVTCAVKTTANVGEPCDQDHEACSADGTMILRCDRRVAPTFFRRETCALPAKCVVHHDTDVIRVACE